MFLADVNKANTRVSKPIATLAVPKWLNAQESIDYLRDIDNIAWIWRYKRKEYQWAVINVRV